MAKRVEVQGRSTLKGGFAVGRAFLAAGVLLAAFFLTACGGGKETKTGGSSKEHVYQAEEIKTELNMNDVQQIFLSGDRLYAIGNRYEDSGVYSVFYASFQKDGSDYREIILDDTDSGSFNSAAMDDKGNLYGIWYEYAQVPEPDDEGSGGDSGVMPRAAEESTDDGESAGEAQTEKYYLLCLDSEGREQWRVRLNNQVPEGGYFYTLSLLYLGDGRILSATGDGINNYLEIYDAGGERLKRLTTKEEIGGSLYCMENGEVVASSYAESGGFELRKLNLDTGEFTDSYQVPGTSYSYNYYAGKGFDFYLSGSAGVYGYNLGDTELKLLLNFVDSDLDISYISQLMTESETKWYATINDNLTGDATLMLFTKVDPKDVKDKIELTMACYGLNWSVRSKVVDFNKTNDRYRIQIKDYTDYDTEGDYTAGISKLNTDIVSGKMPDILILNNQLPIDSYISKGLFEDLNPYIDKDEELDRSDYLENIMEAFSTNGKLYQLVPSFSILTVAGKSTDVGTGDGWTLDELNALLESKPEGTKVFSNVIRSEILNYSIEMSSEQFINWDTGECDFNNQDFIKLLDFVSKFPEEYEDSNMDDGMYRPDDTAWREGRTLLQIMNLGTFREYNYTQKGMYGEDITLIGFPAANRNGSAIVSELNFAMSSKSKEQEGIWQFLRYFITDEYQEEQEYVWPISKKRIGELGEAAKKKPVYEDENGNEVEYDETYYLGDVELTIAPMNQQEIDAVMKFLTSVSQPVIYDEDLLTIISEETAPYFAGQKSAAEVAEIIQSRVKIYVNESR